MEVTELQENCCESGVTGIHERAEFILAVADVEVSSPASLQLESTNTVTPFIALFTVLLIRLPAQVTDIFVLLPTFPAVLLLLRLLLPKTTVLLPTMFTAPGGAAKWLVSVGRMAPPTPATEFNGRPPLPSGKNLLGGWGLRVGIVGSSVDEAGGWGSSSGDGAELGVSMGTTLSCIGVLLLP